MFDRVVLINLDKRLDRLGAFKAKIADIPALAGFVRYRAVEGAAVTVPHFFTSGSGAWGCRQTHLRVLEDAMMDGVNTLLVLEDDACFCDNFQEKLHKFMSSVPDDWHGLMIGGQDQNPATETGIPGVLRSTDTQRTHAYALRGLPAMQSLYRVWARSDRHIDHLFYHWQTEHNVYQPDPFLSGQDEGSSDISGRSTDTRYWFSGTTPTPDLPLYLVQCPREVAERARLLGFHWGYCRDPVTGYDKGIRNLESMGWPAEQLTEWANLVVNEAAVRGDAPGIWFSPTPDAGTLGERVGRQVIPVVADTVEDVARQIPGMYPRYLASQILWCWRGDGAERLYGLDYYGWHAGYHRDPVTGLNNAVRQFVETGKDDILPRVVRQLGWEATKIRYGKPLLAHPHLDIGHVRDLVGGANVKELVGGTVKDVLASYTTLMSEMTELQ